MGTLWQDARYGWRNLTAHKGFAFVIVLSLGLGIGANTAIFGLVDNLLLRLLPVRDPERLVLLGWQSGAELPAVMISGETDESAGGISSTSFSHLTFERLRQRSRTVSDLVAFADLERLNLSAGSEAEIAQGQLVSGGYFTGLGVNAAAGRLLGAGDDRADAPPVAVISYELWRRLFGLDRAALGQPLNLNGMPFTIVGVTPPGFRGGSEPSSLPDVILPLARQPQMMAEGSWLDKPQTWWLVVMGRLRPGVTRAGAQAELEPIFQQSLLEAPTGSRAAPGQMPRLSVLPGRRGLTSESSELAPPLLVMMGLVALVLLVACANVAGLLLARATARRRELGLRVALGASRGRLVRQLLTESVLLALVGGGLGLLLVVWSGDLLEQLLPAAGFAGRLGDLAPDTRVLAFTALVSLATGLLFGIAPALRATRIDPAHALKGPAVFAGERRVSLGQLLVVAQVALALVLTVGAGLFVRTLRNLAHVPTGFNREGVLVFSLDPTLNGYHGGRLAELYERLGQSLERLPRVSAVAQSAYTLISNSSSYSDLAIEGQRPRSGEKPMVQRHPVGPTFFAAMQIPVLLGRGFRLEDDEHAPKVAVVSESLARAYFPGQNPLGRHIGMRTGKIDREIVGVVADSRFSTLHGKMPKTVFVPYRQNENVGRMTFEVRVAGGDPRRLIPAVRRAVRQLDRNLPLYDVKTQAEQVAESLRQERLLADLSSAFGLLCLLLAAVGLYGVMSFAVSRRTRETGIRMTLGARPAELLRQVLRQALLLVAAGVALGLAAAFAGTRLLASLLFGLGATDPSTLAAAVLLLLAVGIAAAYLPARRAALVDPVEALRQE
jgi:predicted permease